MRAQMFERAAGIRFGPREEVKVHVLLIRQPTEDRALRGSDSGEHRRKRVGLILRERASGSRNEIMRLAFNLELVDVELAHLGGRVNQGVIVGRCERHRVTGLGERRNYFPARRDFKVHRTWTGAMSRCHNEQLSAGEESEVAGELRLIQSKNVGSVVEFDFDGVETLRFDSPGLFVNHLWLKPFAVCVGDLEPEDVLEVILDGVPARRPCRKRKLKMGIFDVPY